MDKRGVSSLGVHKRKLKKHTRKKRIFKKMVAYLKSDSYLFGPLVSSQPSDFPPTITVPSFATGVEMMKPSEEENKKLLEKVEDYLKSDSYMYAPLIGPQPSRAGGANSASPQSGPVRHLKRVTEVSTTKLTKKTNQPTEDIVTGAGGDVPSENTRLKSRIAVQRTVAHRETVKHVVHQHCRSSIPGKGILGTEPTRKLVVE
ncbi:hypothetical protein Vadar_019039 [Vaccinium darrowii]|uniref:Uncharacterized protein n=1 Tax=Vaccinium darrowii TaxID=229202 RepID=A0ACB7Z4W7_9ERIC|nr:hypothetical protein Vadar_019039 [Vaccinium darrowii]